MPDVSDLAKSAITLATKEWNDKVQEDPATPNSGKRVNEYQQAAGCTAGDDWCMAFIYWCFEQASKTLGVVNPLFKTGNCYEQWAHSTEYQQDNPQIGDLIVFRNVMGEQCIADKLSLMDEDVEFWDNDLKNGIHVSGHIGIITNIYGSIVTIEGNTTRPDVSHSKSIYVAQKTHAQKECKNILDTTKKEIIGKRIILGFLRF